jgi:hypothetical protein
MQNVGKDVLLSQRKNKPAASGFGSRCIGSKSVTGLVC